MVVSQKKIFSELKMVAMQMNITGQQDLVETQQCVIADQTSTWALLCTHLNIQSKCVAEIALTDFVQSLVAHKSCIKNEQKGLQREAGGMYLIFIK